MPSLAFIDRWIVRFYVDHDSGGQEGSWSQLGVRADDAL